MEPIPPSKIRRYLSTVQLVNPTQRKTEHRLPSPFKSTKMGRLVRLLSGSVRHL
ncbi:UNVERIFIED_CONTAM: hypothetical protein GTU68_011472 [Idotea baltica]|nr:hypothetical protein [Idotea baltica]